MHLDMVMRILQKHKLFAKLSNCSFAQDDLMFFGHVVGQNGLRVDPKEMCLLSKIGLQFFLELTIQIMIGSAALAHPLRHLSSLSEVYGLKSVRKLVRASGMLSAPFQCWCCQIGASVLR